MNTTKTLLLGVVLAMAGCLYISRDSVFSMKTTPHTILLTAVAAAIFVSHPTAQETV